MHALRSDFPRLAFLPPLLLVLALAGLYGGLPYAMLDGDIAAFGTMGNDLLRFGHLPTLLYGQNYLISPTPYAYAGVRLLAPYAEPALALAAAGAFFSLGGLALFLAALCRTQRRLGAGLFWPVLAAVLLVAGNVVFAVDHAKNSGAELSLFTAGLLLWTGSRLEERSRPGWWLLLGAVAGFAFISRLQMLFFVLPAAGLLLLQLLRREGWRPAVAAAGWLAAGAALGYAPMLAHRLWRAEDWPFFMQLPLKPGEAGEMARSWRLVTGDILPAVFGLRPEMAGRPLRLALWALAVLPAYGWALWRRRDRLSLLDHALFLGSGAVLAALVLAPSLSKDGEQRRYVMTVFLAAVWLGVRHLPAPGWRNGLPLALAAGLLAASVPRWEGRMEKSRTADRQMRQARERLVPELAATRAVIFANYWDASLLQFLSDNTLPVESLPWGAVRTYGWITPEALGRRTLWLAVQGRERELAEQLRKEAGEEAFSRRTRIPLVFRFQGKTAELWELPGPGLGEALLRRHHPLYFRTPYPPGSGKLSDHGARIEGRGRTEQEGAGE